MNFERELEGLRPKLRRYALGLCRNEADADDFVQEAMLRAYCAQSRYDESRKLYPWVKRIARNAHWSFLRREAYRSDLCDPLNDCDIKVDEHQTSCVDLKKVSEKVQLLSAEQQTVVRLVCFEGWTCVEAAAMLGIPVGTLKSRLRLARKHLEEMIDYAD